jgi:hypothetical protein
MSRISRINTHADVPALSKGPLGPTEEFRARHHVLKPLVDGKTRREAYQVVPRVRLMVNADRDQSEGAEITSAEFDAAMRWRDDFELSEGARIKGTLTLVRVDGGRLGDGITGPQVDAMSRVRAVRAAIGPAYHALLYWAVALDRPWLQVAQLCSGITVDRMGVTDKTAKIWCADALRALAGYYDDVDGADRTRKHVSRIRSCEFE